MLMTVQACQTLMKRWILTNLQLFFVGQIADHLLHLYIVGQMKPNSDRELCSGGTASVLRPWQWDQEYQEAAACQK